MRVHGKKFHLRMRVMSTQAEKSFLVWIPQRCPGDQSGVTMHDLSQRELLHTSPFTSPPGQGHPTSSEGPLGHMTQLTMGPESC